MWLNGRTTLNCFELTCIAVFKLQRILLLTCHLEVNSRSRHSDTLVNTSAWTLLGKACTCVLDISAHLIRHGNVLTVTMVEPVFPESNAVPDMVSSVEPNSGPWRGLTAVILGSVNTNVTFGLWDAVEVIEPVVFVLTTTAISPAVLDSSTMQETLSPVKMKFKGI